MLLGLMMMNESRWHVLPVLMKKGLIEWMAILVGLAAVGQCMM